MELLEKISEILGGITAMCFLLWFLACLIYLTLALPTLAISIVTLIVKG